MLQPKRYPQMIGQALVFEPDPFLVMVDDDNPWVEGLFFTAVIGFCIGLAKLLGGILLTASLPASTAVLEAFIQMLRQIQPADVPPGDWIMLEAQVRAWWPTLTGFLNYGSGWSVLLWLIVTPLWLIFQWVLYGLFAHMTARLLGGSGTIEQTLGVTALAMAPRTLLLLTAVPFTAVMPLLLQVWGILIAYRGLEVAHDLGTRKAVLAALVPWLILALLTLFLGIIVMGSLTWGTSL